MFLAIIAAKPRPRLFRGLQHTPLCFWIDILRPRESHRWIAEIFNFSTLQFSWSEDVYSKKYKHFLKLLRSCGRVFAGIVAKNIIYCSVELKNYKSSVPQRVPNVFKVRQNDICKLLKSWESQLFNENNKNWKIKLTITCCNKMLELVRFGKDISGTKPYKF